jgi:hypothetical protein
MFSFNTSPLFAVAKFSPDGVAAASTYRKASTKLESRYPEDMLQGQARRFGGVHPGRFENHAHAEAIARLDAESKSTGLSYPAP